MSWRYANQENRHKKLGFLQKTYSYRTPIYCGVKRFLALIAAPLWSIVMALGTSPLTPSLIRYNDSIFQFLKNAPPGCILHPTPKIQI